MLLGVLFWSFQSWLCVWIDVFQRRAGGVTVQRRVKPEQFHKYMPVGRRVIAVNMHASFLADCLTPAVSVDGFSHRICV